MTTIAIRCFMPLPFLIFTSAENHNYRPFHVDGQGQGTEVGHGCDTSRYQKVQFPEVNKGQNNRLLSWEFSIFFSQRTRIPWVQDCCGASLTYSCLWLSGHGTNISSALIVVRRKMILSYESCDKGSCPRFDVWRINLPSDRAHRYKHIHRYSK